MRPTLTPNGRLTARRWCLTAVEGPNVEIGGATALMLLPRPRAGNPGAPRMAATLHSAAVVAPGGR